MTPLRRFDDLLARPVATRSLGLLRALVGALTVWHLWPIAAAAVRGDTYRDRFHHPYLPALPDLPTAGYAAVLVAGVVAAAAMALGCASRWANGAAFAVVAYHLVLSTTHLHNNRAYLVTVLAILSLAPTGGSWSLDAWWRRRRGRPAIATTTGWTLWLLRFASAVTYGASGTSKLLDPDWFGGQVTWGRVVLDEAAVRGSLLPSAVSDMLLDRSFHTIAAKVIVATELAIAAGLWSPRTRRVAVAAAVVFHLSIEFSADVQLFSWLGLAVLVAWADPALPGVDRWSRRWPRRAADPTGAAA